MRHSCLRAAIGSVLLLLASPVFARDPFTISGGIPGSYADLYKTIKKDLKADGKGNIPANLDKAKCGGWNMEESVEGKIATVTNAPGRKGKWDGDIPSGMAVRDEDLSFPGGGTGLSTLCEEKKDTIQKTVSYGIGFVGDLTGLEIILESTTDIPHPYFEDPACLWDGSGKVDNPQTPPKCRNTCDWLNTFTYLDCKQKMPDIFCYGEGDCIDVTVCFEWENRYTCSDEWVDDEDVQKNCRECKGEECRCGGEEASCFKGTMNGKPYASFYRRYDASYKRAKVPDAPKDVAEKKGNIACYGKYDEFDPKTHQTQEKDMRCIIDIDLKEMKETQKGKGKYGQDSNLPDPAPAKRNDGKFDEKKDVWYTHLGQSFSLISDSLFSDAYERSIGKVLGNSDALDKGMQKATVQLTPAKPIAEHSYTRAFDDTAESRVIAKWWQEQQTLLQTYAHGPVLRLVLPSTWAIGASTDPFLKGSTAAETDAGKDEDSLDDRSKRIEVQISADEDTFGEAIAFIERSFTLQIVEEPIPVTIPLADPVELRATAAAWCAWAAAKEGKADCSSAPGDVKELMDSLRKYADDIEKYRSLRALLSDHVAEILKLQNEVVKPLTDWMKGNIEQYKESVKARKQVATDVAPTLESVQQLLQKINNETNMPWCMNQRFTLPIYSLLDPWLPSRSDVGAVSANGLPVFPAPDGIPTDFVLDISRMSYMQTPFTIPVLKPVQVRLDIPKPPDTKAIEKLPDIGQEIERIKKALDESKGKLPKVKTKGTPPTITMPEPLKPEVVEKMKVAAGQIFTLFNTMYRTYGDFWQSMGPLRPEKEGWEEWERKLVGQKEKLECEWGKFPCVHVEMDLVERLTRVGSRPLVMLKEDYKSSGSGRTLPNVCPPEDHVCLLLHPEETKPVQGWEIRGPTTQSVTDFLDSIRSTMMSITFPSPLGSVETDAMPPYDASTGQRAQGISTVPSSTIIPEKKP